MSKGIIYIMETSVKGLIKIGMTRSDQYYFIKFFPSQELMEANSLHLMLNS